MHEWKNYKLISAKENQQCIYSLRSQDHWQVNYRQQHMWMKKLKTYNHKEKINDALVTQGFKTIVLA